MENFIFSLNATIPIFLVMACGYFFRKIKLVDEKFAVSANRLNFDVAMPLLLFRDISEMNVTDILEFRFFFFCVGATLLSIFLIWFLAKHCLKDKSLIGSFVQGSFRSSSAILGIALIQNLYGQSGLAPVMIVASVPLYNIFSVVILTLESSETKKGTYKNAILGIVKNPLILGIFAGFLVALFHIQLPVVFNKTINLLSSMATPLALVVIGVSFQMEDALKKRNPTIVASLIKICILPAIFLPLAILIGFRGQALIAILIMTGSPTTVASYIMAGNMHADTTLASGIVVMTTLFSSVTITLFLFLMKSSALL